jgi:hypothetical protein
MPGGQGRQITDNPGERELGVSAERLPVRIADYSAKWKSPTGNHLTLRRFSGLILPAGPKQSIWGLGEAEFPKRRAAGFTLLAGWCLTSNFRLGDHPPGILCKTFQLRKRRIPGNSAFVTTMVW